MNDLYKIQNKGPYIIILLQEALLQFVKNVTISLHNEFDLMDHLPLLRSGVCIKQTTILLFYSYLSINNLRRHDNCFILDGLLEKCFNSDMPAYNAYDNKGINTFSAISKKRDEFDINNLKIYYIQSLINLNCVTDNNADDSLKQQLWVEHNLLESLVDYIKKVNWKPHVNGVLTHGNNNLIKCITKNKYLKLLYDIIHSNTNGIIEGTNYIWPTKYDCEMYILCSYKTKRIILYNILERNFYYKEILGKINLICGDSNIPKTLYNYYKN